ncbi:MAG: winged helix-turn-helix domain-containing protein [Clostridia bacterium]|nr:winged helix-turn-helix domain-containing protein [Clostridia bacterium]
MLLLVSDRTELRRAISEVLAEIGIFFFDIPLEVAEFYCDTRDTGGVILDCAPHSARAGALFAALKEKYPALPIAIILPQNGIAELLADKVLRGEDILSLKEGASAFYRAICQGDFTVFSTHALTVTDDPTATRYLGYPLPLSKTEHRILRCLIYRAPLVTSKDDLMTLAYHSGGQSILNLSVLIRRINQKASAISHEPLILNRYGKGYVLNKRIFD